MCPREGGSGENARLGAGGVNMRFPESNLESGGSLARALRHTGISLIYQDLSLRVTWAQNVPASWSKGELVGRTDPEFLPKDEAGRVVTAKKTVRASGKPENLEICVPDGNGASWYELSIDADRAADGAISGVITTAIDITERRRREQTLRALLREVSHRSKNLLAIIQSIATQTGRYSDSIETFLTRFRGRLQSLASSQDLVTSSNWRGADLRELVLGQVGRYVPNPAAHLRVEGKNPYLNPNAALHIGLALHELAVNSVSYGALSKANGVVTIKAEATDGTAFNLDWSETIPADGIGAGEKRFGSVALERVVPAALNGTAKLTLGKSRLEYRLTVPAGSFELE